MHAATFFYAITQCCFNIMFQRIFRHTKHEAYHADHEDEAFPESREVREVGGERECLHFQIELDFRNKFFQTRFTIKMEY